MKSIIITPSKGIESLELGWSKSQCESILGKSEEEEILHLEEMQDTLLSSYEDYGLSLFFQKEDEDDWQLISMEIFNEEALLFGKEIFACTAKEIENLMKENDCGEAEVEKEETGEVIYCYPSSLLEFVFEDGELLCVSVG